LTYPHVGALLGLFAESKLLLVIFIKKQEENSNLQINCCIGGAKDVLICSSNETTFGTVALVRLVLGYVYNNPCFLCRPNRQNE
jgi:hypothetical protein